jgi:alkylation response protein AidB-like acyl-CoA dehydrogenase
MNSDLRDFSEAARQVVDDLGLEAEEQASWSLVSELGWLLTGIPEDLGGLGMGLPGACALHRQLGRGLAPVPFLSAMLSLEALCQSNLGDLESWLGRLGSGAEYLAAPLGASRLEQGAGAKGSFVLSGTVYALPSADRASHALLWTESQDIVALVVLDQPGVECIERETWDISHRLFELQLEEALVQPSHVLAEGEAALALIERLLIWRDFALAAEAVGSAAAVLEQTVDYLGTREQFGRPLAMFQALKHRCADLKALTEAAEALLEDGLARATDENYGLQATAESRHAGLAARQLSSEALALVAEESLQLHGGIGMTSEHQCHRYLKRALLDQHLGRGHGQYEQSLADELLSRLEQEPG